MAMQVLFLCPCIESSRASTHGEKFTSQNHDVSFKCTLPASPSGHLCSPQSFISHIYGYRSQLISETYRLSHTHSSFISLKIIYRHSESLEEREDFLLLLGGVFFVHCHRWHRNCGDSLLLSWAAETMLCLA